MDDITAEIGPSPRNVYASLGRLNTSNTILEHEHLDELGSGLAHVIVTPAARTVSTGRRRNDSSK